MVKIDSMVYDNDARVSKVLSNLETITSNLNDSASGIKPILYNLTSISDSLSKSNLGSLVTNINKISENINSGSSTDVTKNVYSNKKESSNEDNKYEECLSCQ